MTNTKDLRAEVEAEGEKYRARIMKQNPQGFTVADYVNADVLDDAFISGATSPDSPLLKKALEVAESAIDEIHSEFCGGQRHHPVCQSYRDQIKEIRECMEEMK